MTGDVSAGVGVHEDALETRSSEPSRALDIGVGLVLPWFLIGLDRYLSQRSSILGDWRAAAYSGTLVFVAALASWLVRRRASSFLAGVLTAGGAYALVVGCMFLPLTLWCLSAWYVWHFAALLLSPFVLALLYLRRGRDVQTSCASPRFSGALLGFALALALPLGVQLASERTVAHALASIVADVPAERAHGIGLLRCLRLVHEPDEIAAAYQTAEDPLRKLRLAEAYRGVMDRDVELAPVFGAR